MIAQQSAFYLVETPWFEPTMAGNPADGERSAFRGFRWWSVKELLETSDVIVPRRLVELLANLIRAGPPEAPVDTGV